jgi:ubiquinone/menaquinone biosynthesis C-methylase UbiE
VIESKEKEILDKYSGVYHIMYGVPFVKELRERHLNAMDGLNSILDGGCGPCLITADLAKNADYVVGIDKNAKMLEEAKIWLENFQNLQNVQLYEGDVEYLQFGKNAFDGYVSNNVLYLADDPNKVLSEMARVLRPGGIVSIASGRPCCNVEFLIEDLLSYIKENNIKVPQEDLDEFIESNRNLQKFSFKNLYEPDEIADILIKKAGFSEIVKKGTAYLDQCFFVVARR